jgi:iron-sulfur cluster assembly protein
MDSKPVRRAHPKVLSLTDAAATRLIELTARNPDKAGLRIGVKKGGCAGMEYTLDWADTVGVMDEVVEEKGARVLIDPKAVLYLLGTKMDWKVDKLSAQFVFNNPNQKGSCGCGESVNLVPASTDSVPSAGA